MATLFTQAPQQAAEEQTIADQEQNRAALSAELLTMGAIHDYPQLPVRSWLAISQGQHYWTMATGHLSEADLLVAIQAAKKL